MGFKLQERGKHIEKRNEIFLFFDLFSIFANLSNLCWTWAAARENYVGWVCCCFSPCSEGFFPGSLVFLPPQNHSKFKFKFDHYRGTAWKPTNADVASSLNIVILITKDNWRISVRREDLWAMQLSSPQRLPMENFKIILGLEGPGENDGKRERSGARPLPRALPFLPSPQGYRQETFRVKSARKRPVRRREGHVALLIYYVYQFANDNHSFM